MPKSLVARLLVLGLSIAISSAAAASDVTGPYSGRAERAGASAPGRDLTQLAIVIPTPTAGVEINKLKTLVERPLDPNAPPQFDGALQTDVIHRILATPGPTATCEGVANADQPALVAPP